MKTLFVLVMGMLIAGSAVAGEYLGQLSRNPYTPNSTSSPGADNHSINQAMRQKHSTDGPEAKTLN
jgi:hypothetical protein